MNYLEIFACVSSKSLVIAGNFLHLFFFAFHMLFTTFSQLFFYSFITYITFKKFGFFNAFCCQSTDFRLKIQNFKFILLRFNSTKYRNTRYQFLFQTDFFDLINTVSEVWLPRLYFRNNQLVINKEIS